jgi:hypothetical protein
MDMIMRLIPHLRRIRRCSGVTTSSVVATYCPKVAACESGSWIVGRSEQSPRAPWAILPHDVIHFRRHSAGLCLGSSVLRSLFPTLLWWSSDPVSSQSPQSVTERKSSTLLHHRKVACCPWYFFTSSAPLGCRQFWGSPLDSDMMSRAFLMGNLSGPFEIFHTFLIPRSPLGSRPPPGLALGDALRREGTSGGHEGLGG